MKTSLRGRASPTAIFVALLSTATLVLHLRNVFRGAYDHDEVEHLHAAWLVAQGERPFVDFFEAHQPPLWYLLAPITDAVDPEDLVAAGRLWMLPFALGSLVAVFRITHRLTGRSRSSILAMLLLPATWTFARTVLEVRPDVPQFCFLAWSLERFVAWTRKPRRIVAFVCGLFAGMAIAFLHKAVVLLPGLGFGALVAAFGSRDRPAAPRRTLALSAGIALVGLVIPVVCLYGAMALGGLLEAYRFLAVDFMATIQTGSDLEIHFSPIPLAWSVFKTGPGLFLVGIPGLAVAVRRARDPGVTAVLCTFAAALLFVAVSRMPFKQFFLPVWLGLAVTAGLYMARLEAVVRPDRVIIRLVPVLITAVSLGLGILGLWINPTNRIHKAVAARILEVTDPEDRVLVQPPWHPIVRRDAGFLWFNQTDFLTALDAMGPPRDPVAARLASRMRDVVAIPPTAVLLSSPRLESVRAIADHVEDEMEPDTKLWNLFVRKSRQ